MLPRVALLVETSRNTGRGILQGIARYSRVHGPWSFYTYERELHSGVPRWMTSWKGDGIIARIEDQQMADRLLRIGCPVIDVLGQVSLKGVYSFDTSSPGTAGRAAEFFLNAGFRHFAFCGYKGIPFSDRREVTFENQLRKAGHPVRIFQSKAPPGRAEDIQDTEQMGLERAAAIVAWIRKQPRPLAVFACNDTCAQQVLNACREHGIRVPEEIAVLGVDNDEVLCNLCDPPLSSIELDADGLGFRAAALLHRLMRGAGPGRESFVVEPSRLVERGSTDVVAIEDPITVGAVRYIRDHVGEGIAVKDVLAHTERSRSDLEQRFRRWLGRSIREEILRRRMDRVCHLLRETGLPLDQIAARAGSAGPAHLCRLFQKRLGQTPTTYRNLQK